MRGIFPPIQNDLNALLGKWMLEDYQNPDLNPPTDFIDYQLEIKKDQLHLTKISC